MRVHPWMAAALGVACAACSLDTSGASPSSSSATSGASSSTAGGGSPATTVGSGATASSSSSGAAGGVGGEGGSGGASGGSGGSGGIGGAAGGSGGGGGMPPPGEVVAECIQGNQGNGDGMLNEGFWAGPFELVDKNVDGMAPANVGARFKARWTSTYLVVGVEVDDPMLVNDSPDPWQDDSVEVYLDMAHDHSDPFDADDFQLIQGFGDAAIWSQGGKAMGTLSTTTVINGGWGMEMAIPWSELGVSPMEGDVFGFDVGLNWDDTGGEPADGQLMWHGTYDNYLEATDYGHVTLGPCP